MSFLLARSYSPWTRSESFLPWETGASWIVGVGENLVHIKLYVGQFSIAWDMKPVDMCNEEPFFLRCLCGRVRRSFLQDACRRFVVFRVQCSWRLSWSCKLTNASSVSAAALGGYASLLLKSTLLDTI